MRIPIAILIVLSLLGTPPALADWPAPTKVVSDGWPPTTGTLLPDLSNGGVIPLVAWSRLAYRGTRMNRVAATGARVAGWNENGVECYAPASGVVSDGVAGFWYASVFPSTGSVDRVHDGVASVTVVASGASATTPPGVATDGAGGTYIAWSATSLTARVKRVLANGTAAPGWAANGLSLGAFTTGPAICSDGAGGVYAIGGMPLDGGSPTGQSTRLWRITSSATYAPGWTAAGLAIHDVAGSSFALHEFGPNHVLADWMDGTDRHLVLVNSNGTIDPEWSAGGITIGSGTRVSPDGFGGCFLLDGGSTPPVLDRIPGENTPGGNVWSGSNPLDAGAVLDGQRLRVCVAPRTNGGAVVLWRDVRTGSPQVRARWLTAEGDSDPAELPEGRVVATLGPGLTPLLLDARSDGADGAFLLWSEDTTNYDPQYPNFWYDAFVTRVTPGALLAVPPPTSPALALAAGPNPSRGALTARFTLPDARAARLELLDLAGRRVAARDVAGAGAHTETFTEAGTLAPGVYLLRLTQGGATRIARAIAVH